MEMRTALSADGTLEEVPTNIRVLRDVTQIVSPPSSLVIDCTNTDFVRITLATNTVVDFTGTSTNQIVEVPGLLVRTELQDHLQTL